MPYRRDSFAKQRVEPGQHLAPILIVTIICAKNSVVVVDLPDRTALDEQFQLAIEKPGVVRDLGILDWALARNFFAETE